MRGWRSATRLALIASLAAFFLWTPPALPPEPDQTLLRSHQTLFGGWPWPAVWIHGMPRVVLVVT